MQEVICVVGMGYVGLPLAVAFGNKGYEVIGYDINEKRILELRNGNDSTGEIAEKSIGSANILFTSDAREIGKADFVIVAVPTPIDANNVPDLQPVKKASERIGKNMKRGSIVIYESTVYPGVTEEICLPILQENSGLKAGNDFKIAYSPERISPGDKARTIEKIRKIVSGMDNETLQRVTSLYSSIIEAGVYEAPSIKVAEAAKVIENTQRDLNIALVNEFSLIFNKLGIPTREVLKAAGTKWNFHNYYPGLVGGHCISVDPHYLLYKSRQLGYNPKVILAGRDINEYMPMHVANFAREGIQKAGKDVRNATAYVMGLTFKENLKDVRNSKSKDVIKTLKNLGFNKVYAFDPHLLSKEVQEFGAEYLDPKEARNIDVVLMLVGHDYFRQMSLKDLKNIMSVNNPVIVDVKYNYDYSQAEKEGFHYYSL